MMHGIFRTLAVSLLVAAAAAKDIPIISNYTLKHSDSCPDVGYYFQRELPVHNAMGPGPCYLCFCQENSTAACWLRENSRCDVERFHHHRVGRHTRVARSPGDLAKIFFRDATRDFFNKQLKKKCEPNVSSFSDGCPPDDWCIGCTVCDCDADGQWDCHVLSFCNPEERKKKLKKRVIMPSRREYHKGKPKPNNKPTPKSKKKPTRKPTTKPTRKLKNNATPKIIRKYISKQEDAQRKRSNANARKQGATKIHTKPTTKKPKKKFLIKKKFITTLKPTTVTIKDKDVTDVMKSKSTDEERKLGEKIVRKVMAAVHKMIQNGKTGTNIIPRVQRSANSKDSPKVKNVKNNKKAKKYKKKNQQTNVKDKKRYDYDISHYWRKKRAALDLGLNAIELSNNTHMNQMLLEDNDNKINDLSVKRITKNVDTTSMTMGEGKFNTMEPIVYHNDNNINDLSVKMITKNVDTTSMTMGEEYLNTMEPIVYHTSKINTTATTPSATMSPSTNYTMASNSTTDGGMFFKYSVNQNPNNNTSSPPTSVEVIPVQVILNNTGLNIQKPTKVTEKSIHNITKYVEKVKNYAIIKTDPEYNDIKYRKWERIKLFRSNIKMNDVLKLYKTTKDSGSLSQFKNKLHNTKDMETKPAAGKKKNLITIMSHNFKTASKNNIHQYIVNGTNHYNRSLHDLLQNLIKELNQNTTTPIKPQQKFILFKYLKKIFKNFFSRNKGTQHTIHKTNEGHTLEILCDNIGACYKNKHNQIAVRSKLHDLNAETEKIFRTIKIIKGLLSLIELPELETKSKISNNKDNIQKLETILKGTYHSSENCSISETATAQIMYLKENVHQFVESVSKFASILNEIIDTLYKNNKKYVCQRHHRLNQDKKKLDAFNKIKQLLVKHNLVQNTFLKNMYKLLKNVDDNNSTENPRAKVSYVDTNNTQVIDKISKNIIENLRRLKNLAKALNSSRRKRQTLSEDDAMEYLLALMEYLLKKNQPLYIAPVNDGIDLLIDAIQNAPDIKPKKKKVLEYLPAPPPPKITVSSTTRSTSGAPRKILFQEDIISDSNRISKEEIISLKNENNIAIEENVDHVYYKKFDDDDYTTVNNEYDTTEYANKRRSEKSDKMYNLKKTGYEKFESAVDDTRRYEIFVSDLEDEAFTPINLNTKVQETPTTITNKVESTTLIDLKNYKLDDDEPIDRNNTKLDWIEENFSEEIREYTEKNAATPKKTVPLKVVKNAETTVKPVNKSINNISGRKRGEIEKHDEKKKSRGIAEKVLYRKQLEFLNSLDYGTASSNFDESDSKDDKYTYDGFPTFFGS